MKSSYHQLSDEYKDLEGIVRGLQWEKADAEKSFDAQVTEIRGKSYKFRVYFHQRHHDLRYELESALGERG
jgi:hypothetical protein